MKMIGSRAAYLNSTNKLQDDREVKLRALIRQSNTQRKRKNVVTLPKISLLENKNG